MTIQELSLPLANQRKACLRMFDCITPSYDHRATKKVITHCHPEIEIHFINNGSGVYYCDGVQESFGPGDVFIFPSNRKHDILMRENSHDVDSFGLYFLPELIHFLDSTLFDSSYMRLFSISDLPFCFHLRAEQPEAVSMFESMATIRREFQNREPGFDMTIMVQLLNMLVTYLRSYPPEMVHSLSAKREFTKQNEEDIQRAVKYIDEHFREDLTIPQLATIANMSPSYYSKMFRCIQGYPTWNYIISCRIFYAQDLLRNTDLSITNIASQCGFNDYANFTRQFKRLTNASPSAFRRA